MFIIRIGSCRPKTVKKQILRTSDVIKRITGVRPVYYRPPWGIVNLFDYRRLGHLQIVLWTSIFGDWRIRVGAEKLYRRMRPKLKPGEVFVLHDCGHTFGADEEAPGEMIKALERILEDGKHEGYRFVGIDEMIKLTEDNMDSRPEQVAEAPDAVLAAAHQARKPAHRIGWFKNCCRPMDVLGTAFPYCVPAEANGRRHSFNYRIRKYSGPDVNLRDDKLLQTGDYVMEMHFENRMLFEMGMNSRSSVHTAIRLVREVERGLPDLRALWNMRSVATR